ncbi:hypothetical protein EEB15_00995 [Ramlibacter sp. WS9]|nr:hypothetical protein EEB15_00995 [Ramlibacter sp. WS9]
MAAVLVVIAATGCAEMLRSDNANAQHQSARANKEALAAAKVATNQAVAARPVGGDALVRLLAGNTLVNEYRKQVADAKPYFTTYEYFSPDGAYIARDTYSRRTIQYQAVGRWRVSQDVLCINDRADHASDRCFTIKITSANAIEFWNHKPGDPFHNLIASTVAIVRPGLQTPEYVTTSSPYQR